MRVLTDEDEDFDILIHEDFDGEEVLVKAGIFSDEYAIEWLLKHYNLGMYCELGWYLECGTAYLAEKEPGQGSLSIIAEAPLERWLGRKEITVYQPDHPGISTLKRLNQWWWFDRPRRHYWGDEEV